MIWYPAKFFDWECEEAEATPILKFRILEEDGLFCLYVDRGIGTQVFKFKTSEEAKEKADELSPNH